MWSEGRTVKGECYMADLEHASLILRMAHKDFGALVGMWRNPLLPMRFSASLSSRSRGDKPRSAENAYFLYIPRMLWDMNQLHSVKQEPGGAEDY